MDKEHYYSTILENPKKYLNSFNSIKEFKRECELCSILDLQEVLKVFESHELYEACAIVKKILDKKILWETLDQD